jgi:uncharacterized damage-inducible protein DinB
MAILLTRISRTGPQSPQTPRAIPASTIARKSFWLPQIPFEQPRRQHECSAALTAGSLISTGALSALVVKKFRAKGEVMRLVDSILMEIDQEAQTTKRVLDRIPEDKLAWKPHPKSFSLGQLALHIASVPGSVALAAAPDSMEVPNFSQPEPKSRQEVLETFSKSLESTKDTLKKMDDARLTSMWSLTKNGRVLMSVPRVGFIRSILMNHVYHHRGQLSVYLRMLDVPVPSIYGPSADENPFA